MKKSVTTKNQMFRHLFQGDFGNAVRAYTSLEEFKHAPRDATYGFRFRSRSAAGCYHKTWDEVVEIFESRPHDILAVQAMMPDARIVVQGEICESPDLHIHCSFLPLPMKTALLKEPHNYTGLQAHAFLQHYLTGADQDNIWYLLDEYPKHVIEFSVYSCPVGIWDTNMVIWEVRLY